jgi:hypothetical protein
MPQTINYLGQDELETPSSIDFGIVLVYTCARSCDIRSNSFVEESPYIEEFVWVQKIDFIRSISG